MVDDDIRVVLNDPQVQPGSAEATEIDGETVVRTRTLGGFSERMIIHETVHVFGFGRARGVLFPDSTEDPGQAALSEGKVAFVVVFLISCLWSQCFSAENTHQAHPVLVLDHRDYVEDERVVKVIFSDSTMGRSVVFEGAKQTVQGCGFGNISRFEPTEKSILSVAFESQREEVDQSLLRAVLDKVAQTGWAYDMKRVASRHTEPICAYRLLDSGLDGFTNWRLLFHRSSLLVLQLEGLDSKDLYDLFQVP